VSNLVNIDTKKGAPSLYDVNMCQRIVDIAAQGGHIAAMMDCLGIKSKDTWYRWQKEYPEFKEAVVQAEIKSQAFYEHLGLQALLGEIPHFSATTYALIMNNKFGNDYKRNAASTEVNITNNTMNLTSEQVTQKIAQKMEKLKSLGVDIEHVP
jgi:hypothetical protein